MATRSATSDEIRAAILMVLSTLPLGGEFTFFWREGEQHMRLKFEDKPEQVVRLMRGVDGVGIPTAVLH